jgi:uncharacterized membrane protein YraQ (UPF0718 family)
MDLQAVLLSMWSVFADASLEIVPYFFLALVIGALIEEYVSERTIARFLTGKRPGTMLLASTTGALIPLCTCGMVPLAVSLRRRGSDLKHTFAFLTAGAAFSVPVLFLTWKVLGGKWALARLVTSVIYGLVVGYAAVWALRREAARSAEGAAASPALPADTLGDPASDVSEIRGRSRLASVARRFRGQVKEYFPWVVVSLAIAAVVDVLVPRHWIHVLYGEKTVAGAFLASLTGLPFYFCSGAELPLVKELFAKGMGPSSGASMLLAVPIVNILTFGVVGRWLGPRGAFAYLALCVVGATAVGELTGAVWALLG